MDSPLLPLVITLFFGFYALIAESQGNPNPNLKAIASPSHPPPPPRPFPPRLLPISPTRFHLSRPPPPPLPRKINRPRHFQHHGHNGQKGQLNAGKKVGLMFVGIAGILQVFVVAFLLIRRRQLFNFENGF